MTAKQPASQKLTKEIEKLTEKIGKLSFDLIGAKQVLTAKKAALKEALKAEKAKK